MTVRVATANVESRLGRAAAGRCLAAALEDGADVVALQEWPVRRAWLLRRSGRVAFAGTSLWVPGGEQMTWVAPLLGDCVIGLRASRLEVRWHGGVRIGGPATADRGTRPFAVLPPRWVTVVEAQDRSTGRTLGVVCFHLVPGCQRRGAYRTDRPRTVRCHRRESERLQSVVDRLVRRCDEVVAAGDSNFHGFALDGLVSAWAGRPGGVGTLGSYRRVDDVLTLAPARDVGLRRTESDHAMVVVDLP